MQVLLSLPENLSTHWNNIVHRDEYDFFTTSDPKNKKIGSGGGTSWLLQKYTQHCRDQKKTPADKKIIIHAGGESRRLPAYASFGKILTPIPVFRWSIGQSINQTLLDIQLAFYKKIIDKSHQNQNALIASGDVLTYTENFPTTFPNVDVLCFGMWIEPERAKKHGVFIVNRDNPSVLEYMLQKPQAETLESLPAEHLFVMDIGVWLLSDKAIKVLNAKTKITQNAVPDFYDLYGAFALSLGKNPKIKELDINSLTTAIVCLNDGQFFHYGTSYELITSTETIQNIVKDQRNIWTKKVKQHTSIFTQNSLVDIAWTINNSHIWIENSTIKQGWKIHDNTIITGVPENDWQITVPSGLCIDISRLRDDNAEQQYIIRTYGITDTFNGNLQDAFFLNEPITEWFFKRNIPWHETLLDKTQDIQYAPLFPVVPLKNCEKMLQWLLVPNSFSQTEQEQIKQLWLSAKRLSASDISNNCDVQSLYAQRQQYCIKNIEQMAKNHYKSVFYQADLENTAKLYAEYSIPLPKLYHTENYINKMRDSMFKSRVLELQGKDGTKEKEQAFSVLRTVICENIQKVNPKYALYDDQIIWGRSPVRIDFAGGWSDTPPFSNINGGAVLNAAINLNGQQPIQIYIRKINETKICLRSIDSGQTEEIYTFSDLETNAQVGSFFSIPKIALALAGFLPQYATHQFKSLKEQLQELGGGMEITLLVAIPKGSGLGTSSIIAASLLGTLSGAFSLNWDMHTIANNVLIIEQLLTTGGGWQDQYGGIFGGLKLLTSTAGIQNKIDIQWLNERLFVPNYETPWLLYYTGITRVAKKILAEIVQGMFLNKAQTLYILNDIKQHAQKTARIAQSGTYETFAHCIKESWHLNKTLDFGTTTPEIEYILAQIEDYTYGAKLLGAGGGGYMLIAAKDFEASQKIKQTLTQKPSNNRARFVDISLNTKGFEITHS